MSKKVFKSMCTECEYKVKEILMENKNAVELEMTKDVLVNGNVVQPQTIFLYNGKIGFVDEYEDNYYIEGTSAIFDILDLLETYVNDMEENAKVIIAIV